MKDMKFKFPPIKTGAIFVVAVGLLLFSGVGSARAALTYFSENYAGRVKMYDIGVTLVENEEAVSWRNYSGKGDGKWAENTGELLSNMIPEGEKLEVGKPYKEELKVKNTGSINQYVRVTITKYWLDKKGNKVTTLSPSLIDLHYTNLNQDWLVDTNASTDERTVLYYNKLLEADKETALLADQLSIDSFVASKVTKTVTKDGGYTVTKISYDYDGLTFCVEAKVDAVQEHNAEAAILSAWGQKVQVQNQSLSLVGGESNE